MDEKRLAQGARAVLERVMQALDKGEGIHPQSLLCMLGGLTGAACRRDVWELYGKGKGISEEDIFRIIRSKDGGKYYFGELLDDMLIADKYGPAAMVGGACARMGIALPDVEDILRYVSFTAGTERFGWVRSCETGESAVEYARRLKRPIFAIASGHCDTGELHGVIGGAMQSAVYSCGKTMNPKEAARIALEAAVMGARVG